MTGREKPRIALSIAGFDPSSGAGVSADLQTFAAHRVFGTSAVTALTVQSTLGVEAVRAVDPAWLRRTLDVVCGDLPPQGIKIGMLGWGGAAEVLAAFLDAIDEARGDEREIPIVFDPVLRASSGAKLTSGLENLRALLPRVRWITPNWAELEALSGHRVRDLNEAAVAAAVLGSQFPELTIVATGGEADRRAGSLEATSRAAALESQPVDLLRLPDGSLHRFAGERVETSSTHGTGCAFSAALLCRLMEGRQSVDAVRLAKEFVAGALRRAPGLGGGHGPMDLLWPLRPSG